MIQKLQLIIEQSNILSVASKYAIKSHREVNQLYDGIPYENHLFDVVWTAMRFIDIIPEDKRDVVLSSCWCHDLIEDARQTYNDVKNNTSLEVAEIVFAVTNEKGRNRNERANDKYYKGIKDTEFATFVKVCDRIANIQYSISSGNTSKYDMYKKEHRNFCKNLYSDKYAPMFIYLNRL